MNKLLIKIPLSIVAIYIFFLAIINLQINHNQFEGNLYKYRYTSITKDHDFNLINNTNDNFNQVLTPTDNVADMHDMGAPIFWSFISDWYHTFFPKLRPLKLSDNSYVKDPALIVALIHIFLLISLSILLIKISIIQKKNFFLLFVTGLSIGIFDYISDQFFNADIFALFLMGLIMAHIKESELSNKQDFYTLAIMMGVLRVIKVSSILYLPAILLVLIYQKTSYRDLLKNIVRFGLTYSLFIFITELNFYTTLGTWSFLQGYGYPYSIDYLFNLHGWKATYFFPRGIVLHTPILLFTIYPLGLILRKAWFLKSIHRLSKEEQILLFFTIFMFLKYSLGLFSITAHYLGLGARQFFIDFTLLCLLFQYSWHSSKKLTTSFLVISAVAILFYNVSWIRLSKDFELFAIHAPLTSKQWIDALTEILSGFTPFLNRFTRSLVDHIDLLIIISFLSFLFSIFIITFKKQATRFNSIVTISLIIFVYSLLNLSQNEKNTTHYISEHGYDKYILSNGGNLYMYHELMSGMTLVREYEIRYGTKASQLYTHKLINKIKSDIISDIGHVGPDVNQLNLNSDLLDESPYEIESIELPSH